MADNNIKALLKSRTKAYNTNNIREASSICNTIGAYYSDRDEHEKALEYFKEELHLSESLGDKLEISIAHRKVGESLANVGRYVQALKEHELYLKMVQSLDDKLEMQRAVVTLGRTWYLRSCACEDKEKRETYLEKSLKYYQDGLEACDSLGGRVGGRELAEMKAGLYLNLGLVVKEMGDLETAEDHYISSRKHGCEAGTYGIVCQSLYNLGDILISTRQYNRALVLFEESLRYAEKVKSNANRVESLLKIAMVRVRLMDLDGAKENLKAVLKLGAIDDDEYSVVKRQYRELCKAIKLISQSSLSSSWDEKIKLYDEIGDTCSHPSCKFYEVAIKYYKMELELAEEYGMDKEDVSKIVFSIAETCKDNGDYNESLKYYQKDLELWTGHPEQEATLWTNIARLHESSGSIPEAIQAYDQSFKLARAISAYSTLVAAYQSLITFCDSTPQLASRSHAYQRELDEILQEHPEAIQEPIQEATPIHDSDNESLVLSTSQSEDEEEGVVLVEESSAFLRKTRGVAVCKKSKAAFKKNEKGETPLHLAAIKGNVSRAVQLIEIGADVNARDHCGWTPLHEACNHGNVGVVRCLLDGGADINDKGGYDCDSTTALMDAATNGHVSIVTLLIDRGADISIKNSQKCTAYDLVKKRVEDCPHDEDFVTVRDLLYEAMVGQGLPMECDSTTPIEEGGALIPADSEELLSQEVIDHWLVDDMGERAGPASKRVRRDEGERRERRGNDRILTDSSAPNTQITSTKKSSKKKSKGSSSGRRGNPVVGSSSHYSNYGNAIDDDDVTISDVLYGCGPVARSSSHLSILDDPLNDMIMGTDHNLNEMDHSTLPICTVPLTQSYAFPPPATQLPKVKVRMEGVVILIPSPWQQEDGTVTTVQWLMEEASERYLRLHGQKPHLTLTTMEGALLCPTDILSHVVQEGEELVGVVKGWETPPLSEHYQTVCKHMKSDIHHGILRKFESCPSNISTLNISNLAITRRHGASLFHTLLVQSSLTSLNLSGNDVGDSSVSHLLSLLYRLPSLCCLDLSCTNMSHHGLTELSLTNNSSQFQLSSISLSHNPLGSNCGSSLSRFLSLFPRLSTLHLRDCGLTSYTFAPHTGLIATLTNLLHLQELSLAMNHIDDSISSLNQLTLATLDVSSCTAYSTAIQVPQVLKSLNLSCCHMEDLSFITCVTSLQYLNVSGSLTNQLLLTTLMSCIVGLSRLTLLDVSGNSLIDNYQSMSIVKICQDKTSSSLKQLIMMDCKITSPLSDDFIKHIGNSKLTSINISCNPISGSDRNKLVIFNNIIM